VHSVRKGLWEEKAEAAFESWRVDGQYAGAGMEGEGVRGPRA